MWLVRPVPLPLSAAPPGQSRFIGKQQQGDIVREIVRTNDAVIVNAIVALLEGADIVHLVLDQNMSVLEGSIGILPRRVVVADDQVAEARRLLEDAGLGGELRPDV